MGGTGQQVPGRYVDDAVGRLRSSCPQPVPLLNDPGANGCLEQAKALTSWVNRRMQGRAGFGTVWRRLWLASQLSAWAVPVPEPVPVWSLCLSGACAWSGSSPGQPTRAVPVRYLSSVARPSSPVPPQRETAPGHAQDD
ncbi:hypothetical protein CFAM422_000343 [Trichoderma lentiforme]|uniref:Uncharacterized protein n=1 Tax=Trichoderma lentiforme TaxID=1567552 RepID=A0A9P5CJ20_9HYPO|nr:hypothetical protein CFAM422_000343 [Trichoderma lentiforme]